MMLKRILIFILKLIVSPFLFILKLITKLSLFVLFAILILMLFCANGWIPSCVKEEDPKFHEQRFEQISEHHKRRLFIKEQKRELSKRIRLIFEESQMCNLPNWCVLSRGSPKIQDRMVLYISGITEPSLVEKVIEECTSTFFKLNRSISISCLFEKVKTSKEQEIEFYITLDLKGTK